MDYADIFLWVLMFIACILYFVSLVYMFYDDLVLLLTNKETSSTIEDKSVYTPNISKLRKPVK